MMLRRAITAAAAPLTLYGAACCSSAEERKELKQTLTSVASKIFVESWQADHVSAQLGSESWSVKKERLHGGRQEGVDVISVDNGCLAFTVVPTRGMSIGDLAFRRSGVEGDRMESLSWASPVREVVHPREIELNDTGGLGWLTGFNEFIVRCGVAHAGHPGHDNGMLLTLHGRIGNIPASEVKVTIDADAPHTIRVCGRVDEQMFKFHNFELWTEVSTVPGSNTLTVSDRLINRSSYEKEYQMIYHTNFGPGAGLESGAQFVAPVATVAPFDAAAAADLGTWNKYLGPTRDFGERCYKLTNHADEQGVSQVALISSDGQRGVSLKYTEANLPAFTLWKNTDTMEQGYVTGLEPGTSFCHPRPMERKAGRLPILGPDEEVQFVIQISALDGPKVVAARNEIEALRKGRNPQVVEG